MRPTQLPHGSHKAYTVCTQAACLDWCRWLRRSAPQAQSPSESSPAVHHACLGGVDRFGTLSTPTSAVRRAAAGVARCDHHLNSISHCPVPLHRGCHPVRRTHTYPVSACMALTLPSAMCSYPPTQHGAKQGRAAATAPAAAAHSHLQAAQPTGHRLEAAAQPLQRIPQRLILRASRK